MSAAYRTSLAAMALALKPDRFELPRSAFSTVAQQRRLRRELARERRLSRPQRRRCQLDGDIADRCPRVPCVALIRLQGEGPADAQSRGEGDRSAHTARQRRTTLVNVETDGPPVPHHPARSQAQRVRRTHQCRLAPFRQRPPTYAGPVEAHIETHVIKRPPPSRPRIVGREDRTQHGDQGEAEAAVRADRVCVPPGVAARRNLAVEARSVSSCRAAIIPESVAIGTPAPGCALPPAR